MMVAVSDFYQLICGYSHNKDEIDQVGLKAPVCI